VSGLTNHERVPGGYQPPGTRAARRVGLILALATVLASAAACDSPRSPAGADQPSGPPAALAALHTLPPIYALVYAPNAIDPRIAVAEQRLTAACMANRGFRYRADPPAPAAQRQDSAWGGPTPFGLETLDLAATAAPTETPSEVPSGERARYARALFGDPQQRVTAKGARVEVFRPRDGCAADAQRRLLGKSRVRWMQLRVLLYEAEQDSRQQLDRDPEFRAANARWQQCMRPGGFSWADPMQLFHDLPPNVDIRTSPATVADARCKDQTGYLTTAYIRLAAMQQQRLDKDPSVVKDWRSLLHRQVVAAQVVLHAN
jgi:hypothetical protein